MSAVSPDRPIASNFVGPRVRRRQLPQALRRRGPSARPITRVVTPLPGSAAVAIAIMLALSALAAWMVLYALVFSGLEAGRTNAVRYATLRENLSAATTPIGGLIKPGTPIALLQAPRADLHDEVIVEGTGPGDLHAGPGHLRTSPLPGQAGVAIIYGRSTTMGAPFAHISGLRAGDRLTVTTGQGTFTYSVDEVRRPGDPLPTQLQPGGSRLLLETTSRSLLHFGSVTTILVDATLVEGKAQPTPPGRPVSVPSTELAMHGDTSVLLPLALWLQGLVVVALGAVWARVRWGLWQAWLLGTAPLIAMLWGASSTALLLLPNLI